MIAFLTSALALYAPRVLSETTTVELGTAGNFAILAKAGISTVPASAITGDIGVSPIASGAITGFGLIAEGSTMSTSTQVTRACAKRPTRVNPR